MTILFLNLKTYSGIVDGVGVMVVEGVFRRFCEFMRKQQDSILT